jgi:hypothetical protein
VAEQDEFALNWGDLNVLPGTYVWPIHVEAATFKDQQKEKPYVKLDCIVIEGPEAGYKFNFRLYVTKAARGWATYFLKKFGYPEESLATDPPRLVRQQLLGLEGKILVVLTQSDQYGFQVDAKGFDRLNGDELEKKLAEESAPSQVPAAEPSIDIFQDVAPEATDKDPFDELDNLP